MKSDYGTPQKKNDHTERKVSIRTTALVSLVLILVGAMAAGAAAAPLEISMNEYVSTYIVGDEVTTGVTGEITILNNGTDDIYDIWVPVTLAYYDSAYGLQVSFENASSEVFVYDTKPANAPDMDDDGANFWVQIPQLRANQYARLSYIVLAEEIPVDGTTLAETSIILVDTYTDASRVVSGKEVSWTVYFNATTNSDFFAEGDEVEMEINHYLSRNSTHYGSTAWTTLGPISNNYTSQGTSVLLDGLYDSTPKGQMQVTGVALAEGSTVWVNTSYDVTAIHEEMTGSIDTPFGFTTIAFSAEKSGTGEGEGVISGSVVYDCYATGEALVAVTKEFDSEDGYWIGNATFTNRAAGLVYVLTDYALWATEQGTFGTYVEDSGWTHDGTPGSSATVLYELTNLMTVLNPGESETTETIQFAFEGVPVIWANATFALDQNGTHGWKKSYSVETQWNGTYGSDFIVSQSIWVVGDYLIKATKHVVPFADEDTKFRVYIVVENIGGTATPDAYIYDMIPTNMSLADDSGAWNDGQSNYVNSSALFTTNSTVATPMTGYDAGQIWGLDSITAGASGNGDYEDWTQIAANKQVVIAYNMTGSGDFRLSDVYIVGVDPINSLNDHTSPIVTLFGGSKAANYEGMFILLFGAVMVAGVVIRRKK